jgi:tRNA A37 methylthiotransferase MiaB
LKPKEKVCVISLGCAKNLVDSEHILGWLAGKKYTLVGKLEEADIAVINTCGFIRPAVEEAIQTILEVSERKKKGEIQKLFVVGCFVQRYGYKLRGNARGGRMGRTRRFIDRGTFAGEQPQRVTLPNQQASLSP